MAIERRQMRGEWSNGMLCSAAELRLAMSSDGLMILPSDTPLGAQIASVVPPADTVFDLAIEGNRPDAMSVLGVARDLAPVLGRAFNPARRNTAAPTVSSASPSPRGSITATDLCDRLTTTVIRGVRVVPSPAVIATRLERAGMRPISNLVDASNYVMLELGIPSHAFDLDKLNGARIGVRWAKAGEQVETLDGVTRTLSVEGTIDGVITDGGDVAVGIAAIMGGATSEVDDATTALLLEIAHWHPMSIARSAKRLNLRSEASARFERNTDAEAIPAAIARFIEIVSMTCPDLVVESFDDVRAGPAVARVIELRTARTNLVLGTSLDDAQIAALLQGIGFEVAAAQPGVASVTVPSWRPDCEAEINVIEEVGRHYGYANIERRVPISPHVGALTPMQKDRRAVRRVLSALSIHEAWTPTLIAEDDLERTGLPSDAVALANPMAVEESILRTSLIPGLLRALKYNANHRSPDVRLFETGHVFTRPRPRQVTPYEREHLAVVLAGDGDDARSAVRVLDALVERLGTNPAAVALESASDIAGMHPTRSARIMATGTRVPFGAVGEIDPGVLEAWGIDRRVGVLRLDLENLCGLPRRSDRLTVVSSFPSSDLDLAFVVADDVAAAAVARAVRGANPDITESVTLFDVYRGAGIDAGSRSLALRVRFAAPDRTLTDADLSAARDACIAAVASVGGRLRA
jgi:phenylalanyl-tRNA synthetase beta chain